MTAWVCIDFKWFRLLTFDLATGWVEFETFSTHFFPAHQSAIKPDRLSDNNSAHPTETLLIICPQKPTIS